MISRFLKRQSLEKSFSIAGALLVVLVLGLTLVVVHTRVHAVLNRGLAERGQAIAHSIASLASPALLAYNYPALQSAADGAVEDPALAYVLIHDKEGEVAGMASALSSALRLPAMPDLSNGAVSREIALPGDEGQSGIVLETITPVRVEGAEGSWGTVRVGLNHAPVTAALRRLEVTLAISGLLIAMVAVGAARWMARGITAPLRRLVEGTEALSKGDTEHRIPVAGARELAELAQAFNRMMDREREKTDESNAYQNQLAQLNATLEEQVVQRTQALEESEDQYRTLVEHSPDSILIVQDGRVRFVNRSFEETFAIPQVEALRPEFHLEEIFADASVETVTARVQAWQRGESAPSTEVVARDAKGRPRQMELRGSRIEYLGSPAAECLLVDWTEAKRLREQLEDTERLRALGEMAGGVAHDFNNLLGAILGRVQLLRARGFDSRVDREMAVIEKAARDGRETVLRIQEFSRTRTDRPSQLVQLSEILADAVEITRTRWKTDAERRNVRIEIDMQCEPVPPILGNGTELREVFTNLILNAVDAMPQGGMLTLSCRTEEGQVRAEVEDTGVGMTEEIRRRMFDPFYTTKGQQGTGLGMSVAYGIVTRHDGSIDVTSSPGAGSRFTLDFPACEAEEEALVTETTDSPRTVPPSRILVIDDEQPIAQLLEDALSGLGHQVEIALSGTEGVRSASAAEFDLVLTDLGMPDMSGWEVAGRIRENSPDVPVVLVTGWGTTINEDEVEAAGIAAVVHKPFELRDLLDTTQRVLADRDSDGLPPRRT